MIAPARTAKKQHRHRQDCSCDACHRKIPVEDIIAEGMRIKGKVFCSICAKEKLGEQGKVVAATELRHGDWLKQARKRLQRRRFSTPLFALVVVFGALYLGTVFLLESASIDAGTGLYAGKIAISTLFAVSLGFILSVWWTTTARLDSRVQEAERADAEYRELLLNFSENLFHIINALNTLARNPPRPFMVACEFLLGEYVGLLQTVLQKHGDHIAGLGLEADEFLDEKIRIFSGIRDRASLAIQGMPEEIQALFSDKLHLSPEDIPHLPNQRREYLRAKLGELLDDDQDLAKAVGRGTTARPSTTPAE